MILIAYAICPPIYVDLTTLLKFYGSFASIVP